jgi:hypothetical protein
MRQMKNGSSIASTEKEKNDIEESEEVSDMGETTEQCCAMEAIDEKKKRIHVSPKQNNKMKPRTYLYSASRKQTEEAEAWNSYIKGIGPKPKRTRNSAKIAPTVISEGCSESARNKPVINGRCAGQKARLFLDSGAEMNVMDSAFLKELQSKELPVKFTPGTANIKCANGSKMPITGFAVMTIEIGSVKAVQRFMVVQHLFPKIIIGIRTMKTMEITINASEDCVYVGGNTKIPFLSRVYPQSEITSVMGNDAGSR